MKPNIDHYCKPSNKFVPVEFLPSMASIGGLLAFGIEVGVQDDCVEDSIGEEESK